MLMRRALVLCLLASGLAFAQSKKVLFDHTGYEDAGTSAYWIIDTHEPNPSPAVPVSEQSWNGGISAWAFDLYQKGYTVQTLPASGGRITYGDTSNTMDLKNYAVFVIPERYKRFTADEMQALANYVSNGGGVYFMGNHQGASRATSRDPNSTDAFTVFNEFFSSSYGTSFGFTFVVGHGPGDAQANTISNGFDTATGPIQDAIIRGANGTLASMDFHSFAYINLTGTNPNAVPILHTQVSGDDPVSNLFVAAATVGQGRVLVISDSAPSDDGTTTTSGKSLHSSYTTNSNRAFHLNVTDWLASASLSNGANTVTASISTPSSNLTVSSGTTVSFAGSATDSSPTATLSYAWTFGDGSSATGASASHTFTNTGSSNVTYNVAFTATDDTNASASATRSITVTPASTGGGTELLANGGFESGATGWSGTTADIGTFTGESAHVGSKLAWLCGTGATATETLYQQVTIPATATKATISFWMHIDTAETDPTAYDTLLVRMLNSSGAVLQTLGTWSNLDAASGYVKKSFDVTALKGQAVRIHFKGTEDSSLQTSFVIDDVSLTVQ
jgi:hypothetical protein